jgi:hypothetical protein
MGTRRIILKWKGEMHEKRKTRTRWMKTFEFRWSNKEKKKKNQSMSFNEIIGSKNK